MTFGLIEAMTGTWVRSATSRAEGDPPHYTGRDPRHPNELGVIWSDDAHTYPLAFQDWDGCRAEVLTVDVLRRAAGPEDSARG